MTGLLEIRGLNRSFGGLRAIVDVTLDVAEGQFLGIIGANGAGKTTLLNLVTGYLKPTSGTIHFAGRPIHGLPPYRIARLGVGRTFQVVQPFAEMSVRDNVMTGALFSRSGDKRSLAQARQVCEAPLAMVGLDSRAEQLAGSLTLGAKKKLELARALATEPKLLLLDEVMGGLTREEIDDLIHVLRRIRESGTTIVMIEHLVPVIVELCDYVHVLNFGRELTRGLPDDVIDDPAVVEAYLGKPMEQAGAK